MKDVIMGIQVLLLMLHDLFQALNHKQKRALNICAIDSWVSLDLELRKPRGPGPQALPVGSVLEEKSRSSALQQAASLINLLKLKYVRFDDI